MTGAASDDPDDSAEDGVNPRGHFSLERRVDLLERDSRNHARSLTEIVNVVGAQGNDLKKLGEWQMTRLLAEVREEERDKALYTRLDSLDTAIKGMREGWTKILWTIGGAVIVALVAFVIRGGLAG